MVGPEKFDKLISQSILQRFYSYFSRGLLTSALKDRKILGMASLCYIISENHAVKNTTPLPKAYAVGHYVSTTTEEESLSAIRKKTFSIRNSVILENAYPHFPARTMKEENGDVQIREYAPNEVVFFIDVREPSIIVFTNADFPGWIAFVLRLR